MKKFLQFLPLLLGLVTAVYSAFDSSITAYLASHPKFDMALLVAFGLSEALAAVDALKANSVVQAVLNFVESVLGTLLDKKG